MLYSSNLTRMYDLSVDFQLQQGDKSVTDYFAALKRIQEELHVLLPISSDVKKIQQQRKQLVLRKFLARLKSELESVRSQILGCAELPALAEVYS